MGGAPTRASSGRWSGRLRLGDPLQFVAQQRQLAALAIVLPLLVWFFEPKFMRRTDLLVGENIDLSQFMSDPTPATRQ